MFTRESRVRDDDDVVRAIGVAGRVYVPDRRRMRDAVVDDDDDEARVREREKRRGRRVLRRVVRRGRLAR
jgi:hypothetical protein